MSWIVLWIQRQASYGQSAYWDASRRRRFGLSSSLAAPRMLLYEKSRSLTPRRKPLPSPLSTYPCPSSQHVTSKSDTRQCQIAKGQNSCKPPKSKLGWLYGEVLPISWRTGWFSDLSKTRSLAKSVSRTSCDKCMNRRTGRPWLCKERAIEFAFILGFLLEISRWILFTRPPMGRKLPFPRLPFV